MQFTLPFQINRPNRFIKHTDKIMLIGSCFTEHMSKRLEDLRFNITTNPNGILFNPLSVAITLSHLLDNKQYTENDLFYLNEIWNCWDFHSRFSHTQAPTALSMMNDSIAQGHQFLLQADWLIITLGSAFQYFNVQHENHFPVANCHRAPAQWFDKKLLTTDDIIASLKNIIERIRYSNKNLEIIFTISPVRHIRDGLVDNNRSKARLLDSVHTIVETMERIYYFPAYELAIDVLRDYRFYDIDMVHPNYAATQFIWEQFSRHYFDEQTQSLTQVLKEIHIALQHKPRFADTMAHKKFETSIKEKIAAVQHEYPYIVFD